MFAGLQTLGDDGRVGMVNRQVEHQVDGRVGQQLFQRGVGAPPVFGGERLRPVEQHVGGAHELHLWIGLHGLGIGAGDIATASNPYAQRFRRHLNPFFQ